MAEISKTITGADVLRYIRNGLAGAVPFLLATAFGALSMTPPEYILARCLIIGSALGTLIALVLWMSITKEVVALKLCIAIFFVCFIVSGEPTALWFVNLKEQKDAELNSKQVTNLPVDAATKNLDELNDDEIRRRVSDLVTRIRIFEDQTKERSGKLDLSFRFDPAMPKDKQYEMWREHTAKIINDDNREGSEFRRSLFPQALALLATIKIRNGALPPVPDEARPALAGMLAGPRPASALADYLEQAAATLPP